MFVTGWGSALGSTAVPIEQVEREFGVSAGKLLHGAGLTTLRRASAAEDEVSLAGVAAQQALNTAGIATCDLDSILATGETMLGVPALGAAVHAALDAPSDCSVMDVGGGCAGVVACLILADALLAAGKAKNILVVSADVHSRLFTPGKVPGEFGGLFGDGASALVLQAGRAGDSEPYRILTHLGGCAGEFASAIVVRPDAATGIDLRFDGQALTRAAMDQMALVLDRLETASGHDRASASAFVIHQPNPRIVEMFARRAGIPLEKIPAVSKISGNLGSSTCGVALTQALEEQRTKLRSQRGPILIVGIGPGLLWAGAVLE
ncbi:MAG: hypothetical protein HYX28_04305 [Candidatus Koribacter versatilis]|uniref:Uncharacterized protein n=1 Tax=Candidatus Korobacter versatilis TaxID=658062 RepID=A0A932A975_9BACT|nr:hypothetical protein [Candidatus Koribacter versatilis]